MTGQRRWLVPVALTALALVPHWRAIVLGELPLPEGYFALIAPTMRSQLRPTAWNALWWDGIGQFWAWRTEAMRQLIDGRLPLWTNRIGCGFPFLANPQTQSLYLPTLLGQWLSRLLRAPLPLRSARLMAWLAFLHTLLALAGAYLLARSLAVSRSSSLIAAAAYGLGSFQTAWALLPTLPATAAWLPLILWLFRRFVTAIADNRWDAAVRCAAGCAVALTLLLLAGHGQIALYALLGLTLCAGIEVIAHRRFAPQWLISVAAIGALAALLASGQLLPTLELTPLTHRHAPPTWDGYRAFAQRGLTLLDWATLTLPFAFGNPMDGSYFGKESFADYCAYAGWGVLALALVPLLHRRLQPPHTLARLHAGALFLLGAMLASGSTLNLPLYFSLPGFAQLGTPTRAVFLCQLAAGLLAAVALDTVVRDAVRLRRLAVGALAVALLAPATAIGAIGQWLSQRLPDFAWGAWVVTVLAQNAGVVAGIGAVALYTLGCRHLVRRPSPLFRYGVVVLLIGELAWFAVQQIPTTRPSITQRALNIADRHLQHLIASRSASRVPRPVRFLLIGGDWSLERYPHAWLPPNSALLLSDRFADARNYDSLLLRHHKTVMALFSDGNPCPLENGNMILLPRRFVSVSDAQKLAQCVGASAIVTVTEPAKAVEPPNAHRVFVPSRLHFAPTADNALAYLPRLRCGEAVIVANEPERSQPAVAAHIVRDADALIVISVSAQTTASVGTGVWLVLCDTAYPSWRAFGQTSDRRWQALPAAVANGAFRACRLLNSNGKFVWLYFPSSFAVGMFLSCIGLAITVAGLTATLQRSGERPC